MCVLYYDFTPENLKTLQSSLFFCRQNIKRRRTKQKRPVHLKIIIKQKEKFLRDLFIHLPKYIEKNHLALPPALDFLTLELGARFWVSDGLKDAMIVMTEMLIITLAVLCWLVVTNALRSLVRADLQQKSMKMTLKQAN